MNFAHYNLKNPNSALKSQKIKIYTKFYNVKIVVAKSPAFRLAFLNIINVIMGTKRQNGTIKCMQFPMQNWSSEIQYLFSHGSKWKGLLRKMGSKRTQYVLFIGLYWFWRNQRKNMCRRSLIELQYYIYLSQYRTKSEQSWKPSYTMKQQAFGHKKIML